MDRTEETIGIITGYRVAENNARRLLEDKPWLTPAMVHDTCKNVWNANDPGAAAYSRLTKLKPPARTDSAEPAGYQGPARMAFYESEEEFARWWEGLSDRKQDDLLAEIMADADYAWLVAKHLKPWLAAMRPPTRGVRFSLAQISDRQADRIRRGERPKPMTRDEVRALAESHGIRWWRTPGSPESPASHTGSTPPPKPAEGGHLALVGDVVGEIMAGVRRPVAAGCGTSGGVTVDDF